MIYSGPKRAVRHACLARLERGCAVVWGPVNVLPSRTRGGAAILWTSPAESSLPETLSTGSHCSSVK